MKHKRAKRVLSVVIGVVILTVGLGYWLSGSVPGDFRPSELTSQQRQQAADEFWRRILEVENKSGQRQRFTWTLSEEQLNATLSSLAEVAEKYRSGNGADVQDGLDRLGLEKPTVRMRPGLLTLMAISSKLEGVVSLDIAFEAMPEGRLRVLLKGARIGRMPVPVATTDRAVAALKRLAETPAPEADADAPRIGPPGFSPKDLTRAAGRIAAAINAEPVPTAFTTPANNQRLWVEDIQLTDGSMAVTFAPAVAVEK